MLPAGFFSGFGFFESFSGTLAALYAVIPSFGLGIIVLTLLVRLLLFPLSLKQIRSMREMQSLQPQMAKIRAKYKIDRRKMTPEQMQRNRQKMNEEVMALYKEHGVNPFGGCLPLIAQLPVFIGLYNVVRAPLRYLGWTAPDAGSALADYSREPMSGIMGILQDSRLANDLHDHALSVNSFLGLRLDCAASNAVNGGNPLGLAEACGSGLLSALPYVLLIGAMAGTMYLQQRQMQLSRGPTDPSDTQAQTQQMMMKIMPVMFLVLGFGFPAGVLLYWVTTNLWSIVQQRLVLGKFGPPTPVPATKQGKEAAAGGGSVTADGKGGAKDKTGAATGVRPQASPGATGKKAGGGRQQVSGDGKAGSKKAPARSRSRSGSRKKKR